MNLLAVTVLLSGFAAAQADGMTNLDFAERTLGGWEGEGFALQVEHAGTGKVLSSVSSKDEASGGHTAYLHHAFILPANAGFIRCKASAVLGKNCQPNENLEVLLLAAGKRVLPKQVRTASGWQESRLLSGENGQPREYIWPVAKYAGQWLRLVLLDDDARPGCYVHCSGFQVQTQEEFEASEFGEKLAGLAARHKLPPMLPYHSQHFTAMSNADETFSESRLKLCETMYSLFYDHFRQKGLALSSPPSKLQVSMFDSQASFEAYLDRKMPSEVTGIYELRSNRFLMYDYGQNDSFVTRTQEALRNAQKIHLQMDRLRYLDGVQRRARDYRAETNIATIMHEVAHQLSFNSGMLNRQGDVPGWLAEGLACYCESTANGSWQGIGEVNPGRLRGLADAARTKQPLLTLRDLVTQDGWLRGSDTKTILLGYAQSWALFRFFVQEQPHRLRAYLKLIYPERISERRLADFQQAFGSDLAGIERQYQAYIKNLIAQHAPSHW